MKHLCLIFLIPLVAQANFSDYETAGYLTGELHPEHPAGNSLLFSSEKIVKLKEANLTIWKDIPDFSFLVGKCRVEAGLYRRTPLGQPFSQDEEAQDDYIGIAAASYALNTAEKTEIYNYAMANDWYFSIKKERSWSTWLGRYPAFRAHIKWAAGITPSYFERVAWAVTIATAGLWEPTAQDPWILSWLMVRTMDHRSLLPDLAVRVWEWRLKRQWGSIEAVFARYFNDPLHPLAQKLPVHPDCPVPLNLIGRNDDLSLICR